MSKETIPVEEHIKVLAKLVEQLTDLEFRLRAVETEIRILKSSKIAGAPTFDPAKIATGYNVNQCSACGIQLNKVMSYTCINVDCPCGMGPTVSLASD